ncbi:MAG: hypothetical protein GY797_41235 [Deltaproteobacteria bacterium]|nr:hypothetical protein [Deltaproteobacteria bacterium]
MLRFIHISDLHLQKNDKKEENENLNNLVRYITDEYKSSSDKPLILITGDIVQNGKQEEYDNAVRLLKPLNSNFDILVCPGNHDYGPAGNIYTEGAQARYLTEIHGKLLCIGKYV